MAKQTKKQIRKGTAKGQRQLLQAIGKNKAPKQKARQPLDAGSIIPVAGYA